MKTQIFPSVLLTLSLIHAGLFAWAHGEDKLGPNGGYIKMPGAFHTEVVLQGKNQLKVYLLDIDWKNPSTQSSSVQAIWKNKKIMDDGKCAPQGHYYLCSFDKKTNLNSGELVIIAKRENQIGNSVSYPLPLQLEKSHDMSH